MTPQQFDELMLKQFQTLEQQQLIMGMLSEFRDRVIELEVRVRSLEAYIDRAQRMSNE